MSTFIYGGNEMKNTTAIFFAALFIVTAAYGWGAANPEKNSEEAAAMMKPPEAPDAGGSMMADTMAGPAMMSSGGTVTFTNLDDAKSLAEKGPTVLFFHASWCSSCRSAMLDIDLRVHELGDVTVVVVDYDGTPELKKKYGITYQHTFVQIDSAGEKIALWNGGDVDYILYNVVREEM
jgi:thiol-disulfide isomerase/thioredoxin